MADLHRSRSATRSSRQLAARSLFDLFACKAAVRRCGIHEEGCCRALGTPSAPTSAAIGTGRDIPSDARSLAGTCFHATAAARAELRRIVPFVDRQSLAGHTTCRRRQHFDPFGWNCSSTTFAMAVIPFRFQRLLLDVEARLRAPFALPAVGGGSQDFDQERQVEFGIAPQESRRPGPFQQRLARCDLCVTAGVALQPKELWQSTQCLRPSERWRDGMNSPGCVACVVPPERTRSRTRESKTKVADSRNCA